MDMEINLGVASGSRFAVGNKEFFFLARKCALSTVLNCVLGDLASYRHLYTCRRRCLLEACGKWISATSTAKC